MCVQVCPFGVSTVVFTTIAWYGSSQCNGFTWHTILCHAIRIQMLILCACECAEMYCTAAGTMVHDSADCMTYKHFLLMKCTWPNSFWVNSISIYWKISFFDAILFICRAHVKCWAIDFKQRFWLKCIGLMTYKQANEKWNHVADMVLSSWIVACCCCCCCWYCKYSKSFGIIVLYLFQSIFEWNCTGSQMYVTSD